MLKKALSLALLSVFLALPLPAAAQTQTALYRPEPAVRETVTAAAPSANTFAVAKLFTHGASFTCVYTAQDRSIFLGCAHAYEDGGARKPMSFDAPAPVSAPQTINARPRLVALDHQADLSIVEIAYGPMPYVMPIAPPGHRPGGNVLACGYDKMQSLVRAPAHIRTAMTYTWERPIPGRSGGALCDADAGLLIGVCHGFEVTGQRRGMYISHATVLGFVQAKGYGWLVGAQAVPAPVPYAQPQAPNSQPPIYRQPAAPWCPPGRV